MRMKLSKLTVLMGMMSLAVPAMAAENETFEFKAMVPVEDVLEPKKPMVLKASITLAALQASERGIDWTGWYQKCVVPHLNNKAVCHLTQFELAHKSTPFAYTVGKNGRLRSFRYDYSYKKLKELPFDQYVADTGYNTLVSQWIVQDRLSPSQVAKVKKDIFNYCQQQLRELVRDFNCPLPQGTQLSEVNLKGFVVEVKAEDTPDSMAKRAFDRGIEKTPEVLDSIDAQEPAAGH